MSEVLTGAPTPSIRHEAVSLANVSAIADITEALTLVEEAERLAAEGRKRLKSLIETAKPGSLSTKDIWHLYWFTDVHTEALATYLGIPKSTVGSHLGTGPSVGCQGCGGAVYPRTRTELKDASRGGRRYRPQLLCEECSATVARERMAQREERDTVEAAREQRLKELRSMPYQDYLRTPEWQEVRNRSFKSAGYRCQLCNGRAVLDVHHRTYERRGCERRTDVIVLCRSCHARHHGKGEES